MAESAEAATHADHRLSPESLKIVLDSYKDNGFDDYRSPPVVRLALFMGRHLAQATDGKIDLTAEDIPLFLSEMTRRAIRKRCEELAHYNGTFNVEENRASLRADIEKLTRDSDGKRVPIKEFTQKLNKMGVVFTGHPVFGMNADLGQAIAERSAFIGGSESFNDEETQQNLEAAMDKDFKSLSLDEEFDDSLSAIRNLREAAYETARIALEIAEETYPDEWQDHSYSTASVATWIPTDWDGREDVTWAKILEKMLALRVEGAERLAEKMKGLASCFPVAQQEKILMLVGELKTAADKNRKFSEFFENYDVKDNSAENLHALQDAEASLKTSIGERFTGTQDLIDALQEIMTKTGDIALKKELILLISDICKNAITLADSHYRINAKQILNALSNNAEGFQVRGEDEKPDIFDKRNKKAIARFLSESKPGDYNLGELHHTQQTIMRQMLAIKHTLGFIDSERPIRFLIAESDTTTAVLGALAFARQVGIDEHIDISPLIEDRSGMDHAERVIEELLKNDDFRAYVKKRGYLSVQFGYSDSGKEQNQVAAAMHQENVKCKVLNIMARHEDLRGVGLLVYDTGGQSPGRGEHPTNRKTSLEYQNTHRFNELAQQKGIETTVEKSFQGGDGFIPFKTFDGALAYMAANINHITSDHKPGFDDYFYDEGRDDAMAVSEQIREIHQPLAKSHNFRWSVDVFKNMLPTTGSRPVKRKPDEIAAKHNENLDLPRAIQCNGALAQMGLQMNASCGVGSTFESYEEDASALLENSKQFRMRTNLAYYAQDTGDPAVIAGYAAVYDPTFWIERGRCMQDPDHKKICLRVAEALEEFDFHTALKKVANRASSDDQKLRNFRTALASEHDPLRDEDYKKRTLTKKINKEMVHGARILAMIHLFEYAVQIPGPSNQNRQNLVERIFSLDPAVTDELENAYPVARNGTPHADYATINKTIFKPMRWWREQITAASHAIMQLDGYVG